jgi:hypothetical protein
MVNGDRSRGPAGQGIDSPELLELAARFRAAVGALGITSRSIAGILRTKDRNSDDRTIRRWIGGKRPIPEVLLVWLEQMAGLWKSRPNLAAFPHDAGAFLNSEYPSLVEKRLREVGVSSDSEWMKEWLATLVRKPSPEEWSTLSNKDPGQESLTPEQAKAIRDIL